MDKNDFIYLSESFVLWNSEKKNVNTFETILIITEASIFFLDLDVLFYFKSIKVLQFVLFHLQLMTNFPRPFIRIPIQENV